MRRVGGLLALVLLAGVLVACGGESNDDESTVVSTVTAETEVTETATTSVAPTVAPRAATPVASPVAVVASPMASPQATPVGSPIASPVAVVVTPRTSWMLEGTVMLPGTENQNFVLGGDGCVGLGDYAGVGVGQQVVVKDATGAIIGLTTLEASGSSSQCVWTFTVDVPVSDFYTVSLPLKFERSYSDADLAVIDGRVQITLP